MRQAAQAQTEHRGRTDFPARKTDPAPYLGEALVLLVLPDLHGHALPPLPGIVLVEALLEVLRVWGSKANAWKGINQAKKCLGTLCSARRWPKIHARPGGATAGAPLRRRTALPLILLTFFLSSMAKDDIFYTRGFFARERWARQANKIAERELERELFSLQNRQFTILNCW